MTVYRLISRIIKAKQQKITLRTIDRKVLANKIDAFVIENKKGEIKKKRYFLKDFKKI